MTNSFFFMIAQDVGNVNRGGADRGVGAKKIPKGSVSVSCRKAYLLIKKGRLFFVKCDII